MFDLKKELNNLPEKPGVYLMKNKAGKIIYVGKAKVLKNRVNQYFQKNVDSLKTQKMVSNIDIFDYIITDSEFEALILECNLIKKHRPKYNILMKDDKAYPYIKITMNKDYPGIYPTRYLNQDGSKYFGVYKNMKSIRDAIDLIRKVMPIRTCTRKIADNHANQRPCLYYQMNTCPAPCAGYITKEDYKENVNKVIKFLNGNQTDVVKNLYKEMQDYSDKMEFEKAGMIRDRLEAVKVIQSKQKVLSVNNVNRDIIAIESKIDSIVALLRIREGRLIERKQSLYKGTASIDNSEILTAFVKEYYNTSIDFPNEIIIQHKIEDIEIIENWLTERVQHKVNITIPQRGEKKEQALLAYANAKNALHRYSLTKTESLDYDTVLIELSTLLKLDVIPDRIEAYDISNTGKSEITASMVVFLDGKSAKREYRRFKVKDLITQDDYESIRQVIKRRLLRYKNKKTEKLEGFYTLPDLILIDGGKGQIKAVKDAMHETGLGIPVVGMAKDKSHNTDRLIFSDHEYPLKSNITMLRLIAKIQNEAHRYAIQYSRFLTQKRQKQSVLDGIKGVGTERKKALLVKFGSVSQIKRADIREIAEVKGINKTLAKKIKEYLEEND